MIRRRFGTFSRRFGTFSIKPTVQLCWMSPEQQPQAAANDGPYAEIPCWPLHRGFVCFHTCPRLRPPSWRPTGPPNYCERKPVAKQLEGGRTAMEAKRPHPPGLQRAAHEPASRECIEIKSRGLCSGDATEPGSHSGGCCCGGTDPSRRQLTASDPQPRWRS